MPNVMMRKLTSTRALTEVPALTKPSLQPRAGRVPSLGSEGVSQPKRYHTAGWGVFDRETRVLRGNKSYVET
jgi:hypothetical protein